VIAALTAPVEALPSSAFAYDASAPLTVRVVSTSAKDGVRSRLVTFASANGRRLTAEIVSPLAPSASRAGVLFVHWLGARKSTNHTEFEPDAKALAKKGATSVLLDAQWSEQQYGSREWFMQVRTTDTDYAKSIDQVVDLRRALDLLQAQPGVDPDRIAYVGHDFGAMYGALLSGVDPRPRWYVLMAGNPSFSQWFLLGKQPADVAAYTAQMAPLDPPAYLARSHADAYMFQFAQKDFYIRPDDEAAFFDAAPPPRAMYVYKIDHSLGTPLALQDRLTWLGARLFLEGPR
jgi:predicted esterase